MAHRYMPAAVGEQECNNESECGQDYFWQQEDSWRQGEWRSGKLVTLPPQRKWMRREYTSKYRWVRCLGPAHCWVAPRLKSTTLLPGCVAPADYAGTDVDGGRRQS